MGHEEPRRNMYGVSGIPLSRPRNYLLIILNKNPTYLIKSWLSHTCVRPIRSTGADIRHLLLSKPPKPRTRGTQTSTGIKYGAPNMEKKELETQKGNAVRRNERVYYV